MYGKRIISEKCQITVNRRIKDTERTYILRIKNRFIASNYTPGQFVMIKVNEGGFFPLLSRPFSIFNKFNGDEFEVLYRVSGIGTEILSGIKEGRFLEITGPLGNGFRFDAYADAGAEADAEAGVSDGFDYGAGYPESINSGTGKPVISAVHIEESENNDAAAGRAAEKLRVLIAGGIGIAPLYSIPVYSSSPTTEEGVKTVLYYGAGTAEELYFRHSIHERFDEVYFATDDGSFGYKGNIVDLLYQNIDAYKADIEGAAADAAFYACGPKPMLNSLISKFSASGSCLSDRLQVSIEEGFGCGIGVCLGCVIKAKKRLKAAVYDKGAAGNKFKNGVNGKGGENENENGNAHDNGEAGIGYEYEYKRVCKDGPVFYASDIVDINCRAVKPGGQLEPCTCNPPAVREKGVVRERASVGMRPIEKTDIDLSVRLGGLLLDYPVMPASGTFGYGEEFFEVIDYNYFGALVTKGISLKPSNGNEMPRICETSCGMINSIGLQNVGFGKFKDEKMPFLRNFKKPVIVNFFGSGIDEYVELADKLSGVEGISALEANISCPNIKEGGRSFGSNPEIVYELVSSVKEKIGNKLPLIVKLTPMVSDISIIAGVCEKAGADVISLINTIPAAKIDIKTKKFKLSRGYGGLSGPAVKPVAVKLVSDVYKSVRIPIIGMGGISSFEDAAEFFLAGATAVAVGTYAFVNPHAIYGITEGLKSYLAGNGFESIYNIIGLAHHDNI